MAKHCSTKVQNESGLIHKTFSNLVVKHKDILGEITNAVDETKKDAGKRSQKLSELTSSSNVKKITVHLLSFLSALFLITKKFNVKIRQFQESTKQLLEEYNFTCSVERFQESLILYQYKICENDGQFGVYLGLEDTPVLLCDNIIPLLEKLVKMISKIISSHISGCKNKKCPVCFDKTSLKKKIGQISSFFPNADGSNGAEERTDENHESDDYDKFCQNIKEKYSALKEYMYEKKLKKPEGKEKYCLIYKEQDGTIKHGFFVDTTQALNWCYKNKESMEKDLPVILITNRYDSSHSAQMTRKKKVGKAVVGREPSPSVKVALRVPYGTSEPKSMDFFMDTGADGGSVGYDREVLKDFIFSMEEIEYGEKPVVFCQISTEGKNFEIQSFDVDRDPNWNALGMEQIKHFDMYHSHEKGISVLVHPEHVHLRDSGACTEIVIRKENLQVPHRQPAEMSLPESTINSISSSTIKDNSPTEATCNPSFSEISDDASSQQTGVADTNSPGASSNPSSSENASLLPNESVSSEIVADTNAVVTSVDNTFNVTRTSPRETLSEISESPSNAIGLPL